ncbi:hypothetical protein [Neoroseomonas rubea]|uniref:hypothetical protein n=1 Tax=Neoroseomonas rubea TaxID=2748666 RepID=UPI0018E03D4D|nr:hypothetical protein [Roseomonas rubea]
MRGSSFASRVALLLGLLLVLACGLVAVLNYLKFERLLVAQQARVLGIIAADAAEGFERGINLGVRLPGVPGGQALVERALASDADLHRALVADARGRILFDTERGRIGEDLPPALAAAASGAIVAGWRAAPIVNGFGQTEGTLLLGHARDSIRARLDAIALGMLRPTLLVLGLAVPLVVLLTFLAARPVRRHFDAFGQVLARGGGAAPPAFAALDASLAETEALLDGAERDLEALVALAPGQETPA